METTWLATTELGSTGMEITRVGFGAWAIGGGGWEFGWGFQDDEDSVDAIHYAFEMGINWIDTAAAYGFGRSEEVVGRALEGLVNRPYVFTKASLLEGPGRKVIHSLKRDSIRREAEASLGRLGIDAIDLYQIHWPIPEEDIEEGWSALAELKDEGLVRHIGVSNFSAEQMRRISWIAPVETLQRQYSLIARDVETELLPFAEEEDIGVVVYSPMGFYEPQLGRHLAAADRARAVADRLGVSPSAVAIAWTLRNPAVDGAIVGVRRMDQVAELLAAARLGLGNEAAAELEERQP